MSKNEIIIKSVPDVKFTNIKYFKNKDKMVKELEYNVLTNCIIQENESGTLIIIESNVINDDINSHNLSCDITLTYNSQDKNEKESKVVNTYKNMILRMVQKECDINYVQKVQLVFSDYYIKDTIIKKELNEINKNNYEKEMLLKLGGITRNIYFGDYNIGKSLKDLSDSISYLINKLDEK